MKATLDQIGRIELPGPVQTQLGVSPGDEVRFEQLEGGWIIRSVRQPEAGSESDWNDEDLNWPELDYQSASPRRVGEVTVKYEHRGRLKPMRIELEESS